MTKEEKIRERLVEIMGENINPVACGGLVGLAACDLEAAAMAILREFALTHPQGHPMTKEEQIRERLARIIDPSGWKTHDWQLGEIARRVDDGRMSADRAHTAKLNAEYCIRRSLAKADAILREFALRPVSQGKVDSETGEVEVG